jgi:hypothetical protein
MNNENMRAPAARKQAIEVSRVVDHARHDQDSGSGALEDRPDHREPVGDKIVLVRFYARNVPQLISIHERGRHVPMLKRLLKLPTDG